MPESRHHGDQGVAIRFRTKASADEVVARLLESVRRTDFLLLKVFGDGDLVYPFEGRSSARSASSWRAELFLRCHTSKAGEHLEVFLARAELFLELPDQVRLVERRPTELQERGSRVRRLRNLAGNQSLHEGGYKDA